MKDGIRLQDAIRQARIGTEAAYKGMGISRSTLFNYYKEDVLDDEVKQSAAELLGRAVNEIFPKPLDKSPNESNDAFTIILELVKEIREDRRVIQSSQATIDKTAQAAIEAAQSATRIAVQLESRMSNIEVWKQETTTMLLGIQEYVVEGFAASTNTSRQLQRAALGNKVIAAAKKKPTANKKGTPSSENTLSTS